MILNSHNQLVELFSFQIKTTLNNELDINFKIKQISGKRILTKLKFPGN